MTTRFRKPLLSLSTKLILFLGSLICFVGVRLIHQSVVMMGGFEYRNDNSNEAIISVPNSSSSVGTSFSFGSNHSSDILSRRQNNTTTVSDSSPASTSTSASLRHPNFYIDFPLCLVHVGKAAGSSVSCGLGLTYADCEGMPRDKLSDVYYMHMKMNTCPKHSTKSYVMTLRNPITRLQSWFDFEKDIMPTRNKNPKEQEAIRKKRGMLFLDCYSNFSNFAAEGLQPLDPNASTATIPIRPLNMTCQQRAWAATLGARSFSYHEWYNYEHYWTMIHQNGYNNDKSPSSTRMTASASPLPALLVLRTEHLQQDWSTISKEPLFRQVNQKKKNATTFYSVTIQMTTAVVTNLCRALCPEIQIYKQILGSASNLDVNQKQESLNEVRLLCPSETSLEDLRSCSDIPTFPLMNIPRRQYYMEIKKRLFQINNGK